MAGVVLESSHDSPGRPGHLRRPGRRVRPTAPDPVLLPATARVCSRHQLLDAGVRPDVSGLGPRTCPPARLDSTSFDLVTRQHLPGARVAGALRSCGPGPADRDGLCGVEQATARPQSAPTSPARACPPRGGADRPPAGRNGVLTVTALGRAGGARRRRGPVPPRRALVRGVRRRPGGADRAVEPGHVPPPAWAYAYGPDSWPMPGRVPAAGAHLHRAVSLARRRVHRPGRRHVAYVEEDVGRPVPAVVVDPGG